MPLTHISVHHGEPTAEALIHNLWLLCDQDCDLAWRALIGQEQPHLVELRPVFADAVTDWGIRSQNFRINQDGDALRAAAPSIRAAPEIVQLGEHLQCLDPASQQRLNTWLGFRYDRPAVPQEFVALARALAEQLAKKRHRETAATVRDVLAQFWRGEDGARYDLVAVLEGGPFQAEDEPVAETRKWLAEAVLAVDTSLGAVEAINAFGDSEVSLAYVEQSFSLDLSRLSWPSNLPGPKGAV